MTEELKPCPMCSTNEYVQYGNDKAAGSHDSWFVYCAECSFAQYPRYVYQKDAAKQWNIQL